MKKREDLFHIIVTGLDKRIIVQALVDLKDKQKSLGKDTHCLDDIIVKMCDAPIYNLRDKKRVYEER